MSCEHENHPDACDLCDALDGACKRGTLRSMIHASCKVNGCQECEAIKRALRELNTSTENEKDAHRYREMLAASKARGYELVTDLIQAHDSPAPREADFVTTEENILSRQAGRCVREINALREGAHLYRHTLKVLANGDRAAIEAAERVVLDYFKGRDCIGPVMHFSATPLAPRPDGQAVAWACVSGAAVHRVSHSHEAMRMQAHGRDWSVIPLGPIITSERSDAQGEAQTKMLAECFRMAGADCGGNDDWRIAGRALQAVTDLRRDYDEACEELHGANGWRPCAEAAELEVETLRVGSETERQLALYRKAINRIDDRIEYRLFGKKDITDILKELTEELRGPIPELEDF